MNPKNIPRTLRHYPTQLGFDNRYNAKKPDFSILQNLADRANKLKRAGFGLSPKIASKQKLEKT